MPGKDSRDPQGRHKNAVETARRIMRRFGTILALALPLIGAVHESADQRITVRFVNCAECSRQPPGVSVWDEGRNGPLAPVVLGRSSSGLVLALPPGYYNVRLRAEAHASMCSGERYLGVLAGHDRVFDLRMRCLRREKGKPLAYVRLVDAMRGLAGTVLPSVRVISMWPAQGDETPIRATISNGAYYFDEMNCRYCVLSLKLFDGATAKIGFDVGSGNNFTLAVHDLSQDAIREGISVRGSPFNAPETLVEGPGGSIWALDRLGNRVAVIDADKHSREYDLPTPYSDAGDIIGTPKFVWVSERNAGKIVRFGPDGREAEFTVIRRDFMASKFRMTLGADGRIWFTDGWDVGAVSEQGVVTNYRSHVVGYVDDLSAGSDGRMWIVGDDSWQGKGGTFLAVLASDGNWQRFPLGIKPGAMRPGKSGFWISGSALSFVDFSGREKPVPLPFEEMDPQLYAVDADDLWFSDRYGNIVGHARTDGTVMATYTTFGPPGISDMKADRTGTIWIAEPAAHLIEEYKKGEALPPRGVRPKYLLFDSSGNLWYSDPAADVVGLVGTKDHRSRCYAFRLSQVQSCRFDRADIVW
jgi:streptogramin lyase